MAELRGISKVYTADDRRIVALRSVTLDVPAGEFTVLVGPSGCGKTTILRLLAGLERPTTGTISTADETTGGSNPAIGYVFQEPRLFPWLTVAENIAFPLRRRVSPTETKARVDAVLEMMGLAAFAGVRPDHLSGGMASRVGLARALVTQPSLLLLDEPFGALDAMTRRRLQSELTELWQRLRPTVVFVTHDVEEAVLLADAIYRMDRGAIAARYANAAPRPRNPSDADVVALRGRILAELDSRPPRTDRLESLEQEEADA